METVQAVIIRELFPNATKGARKRIRQLANSNKVKWLDDSLLINLRGLYASMIRHESTHYDSIVDMVGKGAARRSVSATVAYKLNHAVGGK